jgi:hypothetical protein
LNDRPVLPLVDLIGSETHEDSLLAV